MSFFLRRILPVFLALPLGLQVAQAQTLSPTLELQPQTSLEAEPDFATEFPETPDFRASQPKIAARQVPLAPPPDGFYQTPAELFPWLETLPDARPNNIKLRSLGKSSEGQNLWGLEIVPKGVSIWKLRRLAILCRQHGNEPEASASGARFVYQTLTTRDAKKRAWLSRTAILIILISNPDGASRYERRTAQNVDMNRDWGHKKSVEVAALQKGIYAWKPHLVVDVHQWLPSEHMPPTMAEASGGELATRTARAMAYNNARKRYALAARSRWGLDTLCHRFWGQRLKTPAILLETRHRPGVAGARDLAIQTSLTALWSALETVANPKK